MSRSHRALLDGSYGQPRSRNRPDRFPPSCRHSAWPSQTPKAASRLSPQLPPFLERTVSLKAAVRSVRIFWRKVADEPNVFVCMAELTAVAIGRIPAKQHTSNSRSKQRSCCLSNDEHRHIMRRDPGKAVRQAPRNGDRGVGKAGR